MMTANVSFHLARPPAGTHRAVSQIQPFHHEVLQRIRKSYMVLLRPATGEATTGNQGWWQSLKSLSSSDDRMKRKWARGRTSRDKARDNRPIWIRIALYSWCVGVCWHWTLIRWLKSYVCRCRDYKLVSIMLNLQLLKPACSIFLYVPTFGGEI